MICTRIRLLLTVLCLPICQLSLWAQTANEQVLFSDYDENYIRYLPNADLELLQAAQFNSCNSISGQSGVVEMELKQSLPSNVVFRFGILADDGTVNDSNEKLYYAIEVNAQALTYYGPYPNVLPGSSGWLGQHNGASFAAGTKYSIVLQNNAVSFRMNGVEFGSTNNIHTGNYKIGLNIGSSQLSNGHPINIKANAPAGACQGNLDFVLTPSDANENQANGAIAVAISGGTLPYAISWDGPGTAYDGSQSNVTDLNYNIPNLAAGSYSVTVDDGTTSLNKLTAINEIPAGGGGGSLPTGYCNMSGPSPWQEWIERVILNTIDNTSGKCIDGISCGFNDYSASQQTTLNRGATYPLELRPGLSWPGYSPDLHWRVWVDWNRDGDFEDVGEQMVSTANGNQPLTTSLQVPANAAIGLTKMRIAVQKDGFPINSCASVPAGEIEDYALNIQAGGVDLTPPTVQLSTPNDPVNGAFDVSVTFSEPIQNLSLNNFILLNGQAIALSGSGAQWLVTINPLLEGIVKVEIPANVVFDLAGNGNLESNQLQVDYVEGQGGPCQQLTNVALSKTASQSSVSPSIQPPPDAQYGVDGITNNQWGSNFSLCATRWEPEQWWEVDLGEVYNLSELRIWNAQGPNGDLFVNYWVFVSKTPFTSTDPTSTATQADFSVYKTQVAGRYESIDLLSSKGRYLRVQLTGTSFLMMEEMEVMGCGLNDNPANCTLSDPGSFLFPGDLMFTAFDNSIDNNENDRIEITPFTTLTKGTQFVLTNAEYQANPNGKGRWLAPDGRLDGSIPAQLFTYIGEEDIPVGTPISFVLPDQAPFLATSFRIGDRTTGYFCVEHVGDENHAINISTTGADALFLMQGDWERNQLFGLFNGRVLSGLQDGGLWGDLPPDIACLAIQAFSVPGFHCPYYQGSFLDVVPVADFVSNWIVQSCSTGDDLPVRNATTRAGEEKVNNDPLSLDMGMKVFPNPFSDFTQIEYWLQQSADTEVVLYDLTGRKIRQLKTSGQQAAGLYRLQLEGQGLSGNLYLIRLRVGDKQLVEKITFFEN